MFHFDGDDQNGGDSKDLEQELRGARRFLRERLHEYSVRPLRVRLDGRDLSGESLLVEAMNIRSIGPNLFFAPEVDPGDGLLDVVFVSSGDRDKLSEHLRDQSEENAGYPALPVHRGKHLQVQGKSIEFHLDDRPWPDRENARPDQPFTVEVQVIPRALKFLVPTPG